MLNELNAQSPHAGSSSLAHPAPNLARLQSLFGRFVPHDGVVQTHLVHRLLQADRELQVWRVQVGEPAWITWRLTVVWPRGAAPCPVLLSPDGCWPHVVGQEAATVVLPTPCALAWFDRTELAFDNGSGHREGPVFGHWPDLDSGCLAVWAWGLQCCTDALLHISDRRMAGIALMGHSRGGKAALLAAALDPRVAAVVSHNSGAAGAASLQAVAPEAESLHQLAQGFPEWLGPDMQHAPLREAMAAIDAPRRLLEHIAPRGLCLLQAQDDLWADPAGTRRMAELLRPHWQGHAHQLQWHARAGGHAITPADWRRAADFVRDVIA